MFPVDWAGRCLRPLLDSSSPAGRHLAVLFCLSVLACLIGCSDRNSLEAYPDAIDAEFDQSSRTQPLRIPQFPNHRTLYHQLDELDINWLQFAQLHQCDLGDLVGRRNSGLGRLATDSQRLIYELEFLNRAASCSTQNREWLDEIIQIKKQSLKAHWWNAVFAGPEMRQSMSTAGVLDADDVWGHTAVSVSPLEDVLRLSHSNEVPQNLEAHLQALSVTPYGQRIAAWRLITGVLQRVTHTITTEGSRACLSGLPTNRSRRVAAIFRRYAIPIQAGLAIQLGPDQQWLSVLNRHLNAFEKLSQPLNGWLADVNQAFLELDAAHKQHQKAWQIFLDQCGMGVQDLANPSGVEVGG
ncbi:MAG: DUF3080 family protein [Pseudomonadota bacterium]